MSKDNMKLSDLHSLKTGKGFLDGLYPEVNMHLVLKDKNGEVKDERFIHNTVTTGGKNSIANQMLATPSTVKMGWMAIGTGTPSGTALGSELDRNAFTSKTALANVVTVVGDWAAGDGTGAITEAGTFDQNTLGGTMWMSASFAVINKGATDTLSITWTLTFS